MKKECPYLGYGLGLRTAHYQTILETQPAVDWFEIITENYLVPGGRPLHVLEKIRRNYPLVMHGVSLSIGSVDELNLDYVQRIKKLADDIEAQWISDHLCWTGVNGINAHDLLPLPYSEEAIQHVVERVQRVQDMLGRQILLENVSSYVTFRDSLMPEWEFVSEVIKRADCLLLLDVNNIYVSAFNHDFDPVKYIDALPSQRIQQIHLAGHTNCGTHIIDTHDEPVIDEVWALYEYTIRRFGKISTMIERDDNIPAFAELHTELQKAKQIAEKLEPLREFA